MPATTKNLTGDDRIEAGSTFYRKWQFVKADNETAHDITSHVFTAKLRDDYDSTVGVITLSGASGSFVAIVGAANLGTVEFTISATDTAAWQSDSDQPGMGYTGVWDLESEESGVTTRWLEGTFEVTREVNNAD